MCPRPQHVCSQWEAGRGRRTSHHSWWWWWSINYIYLSYHVLYFIICQCVSRCFTNFSTRKYCVRYELYKMCMSSQWEAERGGEQVTTAGDDDELDMLYLSILSCIVLYYLSIYIKMFHNFFDKIWRYELDKMCMSSQWEAGGEESKSQLASTLLDDDSEEDLETIIFVLCVHVCT